MQNILSMKSNVYLLIPNFYIIKLGCTMVYLGISDALTFYPKHRLWVPAINVLSVSIANIFFSNEIFNVFADKISGYCMGVFL